MLQTKLINAAPVQLVGPQADELKLKMQARIKACIDQMGDRYLLHPNNFVKPIENSSAAWRKVAIPVSTVIKVV